MVFRVVSRLIRALRVWYHGSARDESTYKNDVKTVDNLPDSCLRGLRRKDWVVEGRVETKAFIPDPKTAEQRKDHGMETSVNWEDDPSVESFTLANPNALHGAARIATETIEQISRQTARVQKWERVLSCERKSEESNPYHGNIVYSAEIPKYMQKMLASGLALMSSFVPPAQ